MGDALERLAERIAVEAKALVSEERRNIGVMVNRIHTARLVYQRLKQAGEEDVTLLTGRMRPIDRDDIGQALMDALKTNVPHQLERPPGGSPAAAGNRQDASAGLSPSRPHRRRMDHPASSSPPSVWRWARTWTSTAW